MEKYKAMVEKILGTDWNTSYENDRITVTDGSLTLSIERYTDDEGETRIELLDIDTDNDDNRYPSEELLDSWSVFLDGDGEEYICIANALYSCNAYKNIMEH